MTSFFDSQNRKWTQQDAAYRGRLRRHVWSEIKTILNWILVLAVLVLSVSVLIMKMSFEPGVHVHIYNKTGVTLKDLKVTFSWCELSFKELSATRESWLRPFGAILQRTGYIEGMHVTINWLDPQGKPQSSRKNELYLGSSSPLVIITIHQDGTVTIEDKMQGWG